MIFSSDLLTLRYVFDFQLSSFWKSTAIEIYILVCLFGVFLTQMLFNRNPKEIPTNDLLARQQIERDPVVTKNPKKGEWSFYLLLFLLCLVIPILGVLIDLFIVLAIARSQSKFYKFTEKIDSTINLKEAKFAYEEYGAGGAFINLMRTNETPLVRTKALFALAQGQLSDINSTLHELLADKSDEIRLLSFNILDQQEAFIQQDINKILAIIQITPGNPINHAQLEKNLALLYWELSYRHLLLKELEEETLKKALNFARSALTILTHDAKLWVLLGRIYFQLKEYEVAENAFHHAIYLNIPSSQVLPYIAELKYKIKDYRALRYYLSQSDALLDSALIAPVASFWGRK